MTFDLCSVPWVTLDSGGQCMGRTVRALYLGRAKTMKPLEFGVDSYDTKMFMVHRDGEPFAFTRNKKNAAMITALPELLEASKEALDRLTVLEDADEATDNDIAAARALAAAINKAEGTV